MEKTEKENLNLIYNKYLKPLNFEPISIIPYLDNLNIPVKFEKIYNNEVYTIEFFHDEYNLFSDLKYNIISIDREIEIYDAYDNLIDVEFWNYGLLHINQTDRLEYLLYLLFKNPLKK